MSSGDVVYRTALKEAGLNASADVTIDQLSTPTAVIDAVKSGKDDVGIIWLPYQYVAEDQGLTIVSFGDQYYPGHPCCRFTVVNTTLAQNKDVYVRLEKALIESYHFVKTNPNETVKDVKKYAEFDDDVSGGSDQSHG
jgi:NitT/TauT family transport system substrate-binding protein